MKWWQPWAHALTSQKPYKIVSDSHQKAIKSHSYFATEPHLWSLAILFMMMMMIFLCILWCRAHTYTHTHRALNHHCTLWMTNNATRILSRRSSNIECHIVVNRSVNRVVLWRNFNNIRRFLYLCEMMIHFSGEIHNRHQNWSIEMKQGKNEKKCHQKKHANIQLDNFHPPEFSVIQARYSFGNLAEPIKTSSK